MKPRKLRPSDVVFAVECLPEDIPVRGNALASGDDAEDKACEDEILARLDSGDPWAWCCVKVTATLECKAPQYEVGHTSKGPCYRMPTDVSLVGVDYLGGCSYRDEADFREGGYFDDMKDAALEHLQAQVDALAKAVCDP
jgi:hypothetical protein